MGRFDQKMREVERSIAQLAGNKTQATNFRKSLERKIRQAAAQARKNPGQYTIFGKTRRKNPGQEKPGTVYYFRDNWRQD
jgi:hypothetical protein